jgi:hypothetical protein
MNFVYWFAVYNQPLSSYRPFRLTLHIKLGPKYGVNVYSGIMYLRLELNGGLLWIL